jgi:hypothetical protein
VTVPQTRPTTGKASNGLPRRTGGGTRLGRGRAGTRPCAERGPRGRPSAPYTAFPGPTAPARSVSHRRGEILLFCNAIFTVVRRCPRRLRPRYPGTLSDLALRPKS